MMHIDDMGTHTIYLLIYTTTRVAHVRVSAMCPVRHKLRSAIFTRTDGNPGTRFAVPEQCARSTELVRVTPDHGRNTARRQCGD